MNKQAESTRRHEVHHRGTETGGWGGRGVGKDVEVYAETKRMSELHAGESGRFGGRKPPEHKQHLQRARGATPIFPLRSRPIHKSRSRRPGIRLLHDCSKQDPLWMKHCRSYEKQKRESQPPAPCLRRRARACVSASASFLPT